MHSIYIKYTSHNHKQLMKAGAALVITISSVKRSLSLTIRFVLVESANLLRKDKSSFDL